MAAIKKNPTDFRRDLISLSTIYSSPSPTPNKK
jgi:hypothetical protein